MAEEQEEEEEWSLLGLGVKDDMSLEACLILASGNARNTLPRLQSQTPLEPVAHALQGPCHHTGSPSSAMQLGSGWVRAQSSTNTCLPAA